MRRSVPLSAATALLLVGAACVDQDVPSPLGPGDEISAARGPAVQHIATTTTGVLTTVGNVKVFDSGFGSAMAMVPGSAREFYLLTDRGPNIDGVTSAIKQFPAPSFTPTIYRARMAGSSLRITGMIPLKRPDGVTPISGLPIPSNQCGSTLEIAQTLDGTVLAPDPYGLDAEGIVALPDGTFWLSDEYGPFIAHYAANGREMERLTPCNGGIPEVYKLRRPNRGMEGLTITPDGDWLVGIMQAPLENPASAGVRNVSRLTRVLFRHRVTGETREYAYLLDAATLQGNSEILALSDTRFLVIERDGTFAFGTPAATMKMIYEFDIAGATDISEMGTLGAAPIGGKTLEQATVAELTAAGVVPVTKTPRIDLVALGYPHDKPEGLALAPGGMLFIVNDDDFGISQQAGALVQKLLPPTTEPDRVTLWQIRLP